MIALERGKELHGRSCTGEALKPEEMSELEAWYSEMDAEEAGSYQSGGSDPSTDELQNQLGVESRILRETLANIGAIRARNKALSQEIATLKRGNAKRRPAAVS